MLFRSLKIKNVAPNGTADAVLYIEQFKITDGSGSIMASLKDIPQEALVSHVEIDAKGNFNFKNIVYMLVSEGNNILVSSEVKDGQVSGTAQAGDTKLNVYAEFDPKTGSLKAGYSLQTVKQPQAKKVEVSNDAQKIDLIPMAFLDMLKLPEETVEENSEVKMSVLEYSFTTKVDKITGNTASIHLDIKTDRSHGNTTTDLAKSGMESNDDGTEMMSGMDLGGTDMGGMNTGSSAESTIPQMDINGIILFDFDVVKGIFSKLSGNLTSTTKIMGVEIKVVSDLKMNLIN